jgi:hypothetical protein
MGHGVLAAAHAVALTTVVTTTMQLVTAQTVLPLKGDNVTSSSESSTVGFSSIPLELRVFIVILSAAIAVRCTAHAHARPRFLLCFQWL